VPHMGSWDPQTTEERLDRLEAIACIRQLAMRFGLMVDTRDMDGLVDLYVPDVRVGRSDYGREALKRWFTETLRHPLTTIHFVGNHIIDFEAADRARGIVYCRDEVEKAGDDRWDIGVLQYWDTYQRIDNDWYFERRKVYRWYMVDALERPTSGARAKDRGNNLLIGQLPEAFPTWDRFWADAEQST
jgi:SnoaL-like domain